MEPLENMVDMTAKLFECDRDEMYHYLLRLCSKFCANIKKKKHMFMKLHSWCEGQWMISIARRQYICSVRWSFTLEKHCTSALCVCVSTTELQSQRPIDTHLVSQHLIVLTAWSWVSPIASSKERKCVRTMHVCKCVCVRADRENQMTGSTMSYCSIFITLPNLQKLGKARGAHGLIWRKFQNSLSS